MKKSWAILKGIINKQRTYKIIQKEFFINGEKTTDEQSIVNTFNNFYTNVGKQLDKKNPSI